MTLSTAEAIVKAAVEFTKGERIVFTFQGGEPMLSGADFYRSFIDFVKKHNKYHSPVIYCLQTNGTLINDEWCMLFKENNFLLGVSIDGSEQQNSYRVYPNGKPAFDDVVKGIELLQRYGVQFNALSVITKQLANSIRDNYRFMKQHGIYDFQYINCLKPFDGDYDASVYMDNKDYSEFLLRAFKLYYNDNTRGNRVSIRSFDNYLMMLSGGNAEQCGMNGFCSNQFVVEGDGTVYPCDFYCTDEWELGNINEKSFAQLQKSEKARSFLKSGYCIDDKCKGCEYFAVCRGGGCRRDKEDADRCEAYKKFFSSSVNMMKIMIKGC